METVKDPWKELWSQLGKSEKKELLVKTAKQRFILSSSIVAAVLYMICTTFLIVVFVAIYSIFVLTALHEQLKKNLLQEYPHLLDKQEIDEWTAYQEKLLRENPMKFPEEPAFEDSFHNSCAINQPGTLAYSRTH